MRSVSDRWCGYERWIDKKGETQGGTCHNDKPGLDSEKV